MSLLSYPYGTWKNYKQATKQRNKQHLLVFRYVGPESFRQRLGWRTGPFFFELLSELRVWRLLLSYHTVTLKQSTRQLEVNISTETFNTSTETVHTLHFDWKSTLKQSTHRCKVFENCSPKHTMWGVQVSCGKHLVFKIIDINKMIHTEIQEHSNLTGSYLFWFSQKWPRTKL
jgi:hypothetical protein